MSEEDPQGMEEEGVEASAPADVSLDGINQNVVKSIPITLNVEVGKTKLKLKDLMAVAQGGVPAGREGAGDRQEGGLDLPLEGHVTVDPHPDLTL